MKKSLLIKSLFMAIVTIIMATCLSSCVKENEDFLYSYVAEGNVFSSGDLSDGIGALFAIGEYTEAINKVVKDGYTTEEKDDEVIAACEKVYQSQRAKYPKMAGEVSIKKTKFNTSGEAVDKSIIKNFTF